MSQTFTYTFLDPNEAAGDTIDLTVTASTTATQLSFGSAYGVTAITGTIDGVSITGEMGQPAAVQNSGDGHAIFDNAVFMVPSDGGEYSGASGSAYGLDVYGLEFSAGGLEYNVFEQNGQFQVFDTANPSPRDITLDLANSTVPLSDAPCFCAGTGIATPQGQAAVETLHIGDLVTLADGGTAPITWIGRRIVAARFADPLRSYPIRLRAHALADAIPARDLLLSPDHALLVDGLLVQAAALVNGVSITRETSPPETFTYYHIETAAHALILAENAPAETFIDNIGRMAFDNWPEHEALYGDAPSMAEMPYPRAKSARQLPQPTRQRLAARAVAHALGDETAA